MLESVWNPNDLEYLKVILTRKAKFPGLHCLSPPSSKLTDMMEERPSEYQTVPDKGRRTAGRETPHKPR